MELHVLADDSRLPDARRWQDGINALGFDVKLDPTLSVREQRGFLPCTFKGQQSGFEFHIWPASDILETYPEFEERLSGCNTSANFRWGGDMVEMACALIASVALAKVSDGVWFDPQEGVCLTASEALAQVKTDLVAAEL
jgi:hypothetical protein